MNKEEKKQKHLNELNKARAKRFRENHLGEYKRVNADISTDKYNKFLGKLEKVGLTQKQFIENAIDDFLKR